MRLFFGSLIIGAYMYAVYCWFTLLWWVSISLYTQHLVSLSMFDAVSVVIGIIGLINQVRSKE